MGRRREGRRGERKARRELLLSKINQSIEKAQKYYFKKKIKIPRASTHTPFLLIGL